MQTLLTYIVIIALALTFLDFTMSNRAKKTISDLIIDTWIMLSERSFGQLTSLALSYFEDILANHLGRNLFGWSTIKLCFKVNLYFMIVFVIVFGLDLIYNWISSDLIYWAARKTRHTAIHEQTLALYRGVGEWGPYSTLRSWIRNINDLSVEQYKDAYFINAISRLFYFSILSFMISFPLSFTSLIMTRWLIRLAIRRLAPYLIGIDIVVGLILGITSSVGMTYAYAGLWLSHDTYTYMYDFILRMFGLSFTQVRGIFQTVADYAWAANEYINDIGFVGVVFIIIYDIWTSLVRVVNFDLSIGGEQTIKNYCFGLSMAPTIIYFAMILLFFTLRIAEPFRERVAGVLAWLHDHPKGPVSIAAASVGFLAAVIKVIFEG